MARCIMTAFVLFLWFVHSVQSTTVDLIIVHSDFKWSSHSLVKTITSVTKEANVILRHVNVTFAPYFIPDTMELYNVTKFSDNVERLLAEQYYRSLNAGHKSIVISLNCTDDIQIGNLTKNWDILYLTSGPQCKRHPENHEVYFGVRSTDNYAQALVDVLRRYGWHHVFFLVDESDENFRKLHRDCAAALHGYDKLYSNTRSFDGHRMNTSAIRTMLYEFKNQSRILIAVTTSKLFRTIMVHAAGLNMTNGDYMYIAMEWLVRVDSDFSWERGDEMDQTARHAFRSALIISSPIHGRMSERQLTEARAAATLTAIRSTALILNDLSPSTASKLLDSGRKLGRRCMNRSFTGASTYPVYISQHRLREFNMSVRSMNIRTGAMQAALLWNVHHRDFIPLNQICWPSTLGPPLDVPECGYRGDGPPCSYFTVNYKWLFAGMVGAAYMCWCVVVLVRLQIRSHNTQDDRWWDIKMNLITRSLQAHHNVSTRNLLNGLTSDKERTAAVIAGDKFVGRATLHNEEVWIKFIYFNPMNVSASANLLITGATRILLKQLGNCLHINICKFYGLCTISTGYSQRVYAVDEWCERGNLHGLLDIRNLDWTFRSSLMSDLLEGMTYMHSKPIAFHGHLNEFKCLINRRFMLKIGETGLDRIKRLLLANTYTDNSDVAPNKLYWTAPELLRNASQPNQATDVYSVGILLYQMLVWTEPYDEQMEQYSPNEIVAAIVHEDSAHRHSLRPTLVGHDISKLVRQALQACWSSNARIRPKMKDLRKDIYGACGISASMNLTENLLRRFDAYIHEMETQLQERTDMAVNEITLFQQRLYELWPKEIAVKIWNDQSVHAASHENVTILCGDVVDFEDVIDHLTPTALFLFLKDFALVLNQACAGLSVMKIELLGANYIYCSGIIHHVGKEPALEVSKAANNIRECFTSSSKLQWLTVHIRIGICTGPCVTGVIDPARPRYCLLGPTLKTASYLCKQGDPNCIYLSYTTAERLMRYGETGFVVTHVPANVPSPRFYSAAIPDTYYLEPRAQTSALTPERALPRKSRQLKGRKSERKPAVHVRVSSTKSLLGSKAAK